MTGDSNVTGRSGDEDWDRYGRALLQGMNEVLAETSADVHSMLLETADYWFSLGLAIGSSTPDAAKRLLSVIESEEAERADLAEDAAQFLNEALE